MTVLGFPLLLDENVSSEVALALASRPCDVWTVQQARLLGASDVDVIRHAHVHGRVIVTHDSDFGRLAIQANEPVVGIVYCGPDNIAARFVLDMIHAIDASEHALVPPFIVVAERRDQVVRVRVRRLG